MFVDADTRYFLTGFVRFSYADYFESFSFWAFFVAPSLLIWIGTYVAHGLLKNLVKKNQKTAVPTIKGMLKINSRLNLKETAGLLSWSKKELKHFIFQLAATGDITGKFEGDDFVLSEGEKSVDAFIAALEHEFATWTRRETTKESKIN